MANQNSTEENENGTPVKIAFKNTETFNFGFDVVDEIAEKYPDKLAMIHLDKHKNERDFTFSQIKKESARVANYFKSLGIKRCVLVHDHFRLTGSSR